MGAANGDKFDVLAFFKDELAAKEQLVRLQSVRKIKFFMHSIDDKNIIQKEVVPYLADIAKQDTYLNDDEFLFLLAKAYAQLLPYVIDAECLLAPLEWLACQEETVVRDAGVEGLGALCGRPEINVPEIILPVLNRLATADWFTARLSVCPLFANVYPLVSDQQKAELRKSYGNLCSDETPMVRRSAAINLRSLVVLVDRQSVINDIIPLYRQLAQDDTQDIIRVSSLLKDPEQEVRAEAVNTIAKLLDPQTGLTVEQLQNFIIPQFQPLTMDGSIIVRAALAKSIAQVAQTVGREVTQKFLLALIADLMKDDSHEVRVNIVKNAAAVCAVIGMDVLAHSLLLTIQNLIMDPQWRIRKLVIEQVPLLAQQFGVEMFQQKLEALFISSLADSVYAVRQAAIVAIAEIAGHFGCQWVENQFWPKVIEQYSVNSGFGGRLTILQCLPQFAVVMPQDYIISLIIPTLFRAAKDLVPNVRLISADILEYFVRNHKLPKVYIAGTIQPALTSLLNDADGEVQFRAEQTLKAVQEALADPDRK